MTVKDLREIVGDDDRFDFLNEKGQCLANVDINLMLSREVIGLEVEDNMLNVTLKNKKKITLLEYFKDTLLNPAEIALALEGIVKCEICPLKKDCANFPDICCSDILETYIELE